MLIVCSGVYSVFFDVLPADVHLRFRSMVEYTYVAFFLARVLNDKYVS